MDTGSEYIPGTCNIGKEEIKRRLNGAILAGVISVTLIAVLLLTCANPLWRLTLFVPLSWFGISIQQWYNKFCVAFGLKGIFNFGNLGNATTIEQKEMLKADRAKAWKMIIQGLLFAAVVTAVFFAGITQARSCPGFIHLHFLLF